MGADRLEILLGVLGGLGLFLFGMRNMADGLQKSAGARLKRLLEVLTQNPIAGVITGTVVTALLQSSSTTTVMVVGFVNARLMGLAQAVGVIMGANIGTTVTAQLIAFRLEGMALPAIALGAPLAIFARRERLRSFGHVIMGFGLLFLGLELMKDSLRPLRELALFREMFVSFGERPLLGVLAGAFMTVVVQSSSAAIGLLQSLAAEGLVNIEAALPILFGDNIGTTITAVLSSIAAGVTARRAAAAHVVFNVIGTILFLAAFPLVLPIVVASSADIVRQIANAHALFNVANTIIQLPFISVIIWLALRLVPGREETDDVDSRLRHLDERLLDTPTVAIDVARKEVLGMAELARKNAAAAMDLFYKRDREPDEVFRREGLINQLNRAIAGYLAQVMRRKLPDEASGAARQLHNIIANVERVGDHAENIAELAVVSREEQLVFSRVALDEIREMSQTALKAFDAAIAAWRENDLKRVAEVFQLEQRVDLMEEEIRASHIQRLNRNECQPAAGIVFLDIASNLERVADHAANIAALVPKEIGGGNEQAAAAEAEAESRKAPV